MTTTVSSSSEVDHPGNQTVAGDGLDGPRRLPLTRLDEQVPSRGQPRGHGCYHAAHHVEPVGAAVKGDERLVQARLGRHQRDGGRGHVGRVGNDDVDATAKRGRQRVEEVTLEHLAAGSGDVPPGASAPRPGPGRRRRARHRPARRPPPRRVLLIRSTDRGRQGVAARARRPVGPGARCAGAAGRRRGRPRSEGRRTPPSPRCARGARRLPAGRPSSARSAGSCAAETRSSASSSAKTQPAARSLVTTSDRMLDDEPAGSVTRTVRRTTRSASPTRPDRAGARSRPRWRAAGRRPWRSSAAALAPRAPRPARSPGSTAAP